MLNLKKVGILFILYSIFPGIQNHPNNMGKAIKCLIQIAEVSSTPKMSLFHPCLL